VDVGSAHFVGRSPTGRLEDFHGIRIVYRADVEQVREPEVLDVGGSTSQAAWVALADLPQLVISEATGRWLDQLLPTLVE
jgi:hypothetical protein